MTHYHVFWCPLFCNGTVAHIKPKHCSSFVVLQAKIQEQPISAEEAHKLKEQEYQLKYAIAHNEQETKTSYKCVAEFQMCYNRSIQQIDKARQQINDKLRKVTSLMASWSTTMSYPNLSLIEYDSNKRSSYEVIKNLTDQAKNIKVQ